MMAQRVSAPPVGTIKGVFSYESSRMSAVYVNFPDFPLAAKPAFSVSPPPFWLVMGPIRFNSLLKGETTMKKQYLGLIALSPLSAFAAVPEAVTTAITSAGVDAQAVAVAVFVVLVGIYAVKLLRKGL